MRSRFVVFAKAALLGAAVALAALVVVAGCGHLASSEDLSATVAKHHIDLRWGRLGNAALSVKPELRAAFVEAWNARAEAMELQDIEVENVVVTPDGGAADVAVAITYVDRSTMSVKTVRVMERWVRTDSGWLAEKPATL